MSHIFLENIFEYDLNKNEVMETSFKYNKHNGYWEDKSNKPCILNPNFSKPRTKKEDRETGEDQKGE